VLVSDFDYELPEELIAQTPLGERGASRMLVLSRQQRSFHDDIFVSLSRYLRPGDCLVLNNSRVFPARLHGRRNNESGAEVEIFLVRQRTELENEWNALVKPAKRVRRGDRILFGAGLTAEILAEGEFGERTLRFDARGSIGELVEQLGRVPLPPYIHREPDAADRDRYQTVYAAKNGSIAAPTAGLHFTPAVLEECRARGATIAYITLHVGLGTFAPLRVAEVSKIRLHEEFFAIDEENAARLREAKRLVCVGTTSVRTVETMQARGGFRAMLGETDLFVSPGYQFRAAGAMLTNFHLPQSSLLILVAAFAGRDFALEAYRHAVRERYRFFSYGDCMLIE
jgi:S-adenosylmethionine:tRNA ribosyltransferase-isomerase